MRILLALIALVLAAPQAKEVRIPFVGCPADGQVGPIDPPRGEPKTVLLDDVPAEEIAFYKGAQSPGVFAPRGWHCQVWYGSSGSNFVVTPATIGPPIPAIQTFKDEAVELAVILGATSGRYEAAKYDWLFPSAATRSGQSVNDIFDIPVSGARPQAYANDIVRSLSRVAVEFTTPANSTGLGIDR